MIHQAKSLIKFLKVSTNKHGIHSPFVYNLVTRCFNDKKKYPQYQTLKLYRKVLRSNMEHLEIKDFGQGSRVFKSSRRRVSSIYRNAGMKKDRQKLLFRLAKYLHCESILELGTSLGLATAALSISNEYAQVTTVEGCPNTAKMARKHFEQFGFKNIVLQEQLFQQFLRENNNTAYDLIFIDGDHNKERTLEYFEVLIGKTHNNSVIIFDDIYWSKGMTEAWETIIADERVTVSIDTFQWGIIFFRKEQTKQHFVVRV